MVAVAHIPIVSRFVFSTNLYLDCSEENLTLNKNLSKIQLTNIFLKPFKCLGTIQRNKLNILEGFENMEKVWYFNRLKEGERGIKLGYHTRYIGKILRKKSHCLRL